MLRFALGAAGGEFDHAAQRFEFDLASQHAVLVHRGLRSFAIGKGKDLPLRRAGKAHVDPTEGPEVGFDAVAVDPSGRLVGHRRVGLVDTFAAEIQLDPPVPVAAEEGRVAVA
jgi:hypothetical protein